MTKRLKSDVRKEDILAAAIPLAEKHGYQKVTREQIVKAAGCVGGTLHHHFGTMQAFRKELMRYAVRIENLAVIAQGLSCGDAQARKAPEDTRRLALAVLL